MKLQTSIAKMKNGNKKIQLSLLLFLFCLNLSYGQVSLGIKSGINIATTNDLIANSKNRLGWYGGVLTVMPVYKKFFLQPELNFSTKGYAAHNDIDDSKTVLRLNYLNVPTLLGYKIDNRTSLLIGTEFGYMTSAHLMFLNKENFNVSKNYPSKFDVGLDFGLNYRSTKDIGVELRYNYGFKTLYYIDAAGIRRSENRGGNRVFQIGVNYIFLNRLTSYIK